MCRRIALPSDARVVNWLHIEICALDSVVMAVRSNAQGVERATSAFVIPYVRRCALCDVGVVKFGSSWAICDVISMWLCYFACLFGSVARMPSCFAYGRDTLNLRSSKPSFPRAFDQICAMLIC